MTLNNIQRKLKRLPHEVKQRVKRIPARVMEKIFDSAYFMRTGKVKMKDDIRRYAEETGVIPDIHPDDFIFQFVVKFPGFMTNEQAVKYYFHDGASSAKKLSNLLFSQLDVKRSPDTSFLEFASGYGCVTRHLTRELAPLNLVSCDIHAAACTFIESTMGVKTILSATKPENLGIKDNSFDVVFALSFFSHMPERTWGRWLKTLFDKVKPGGYLIFTTHGLTTWENCGKPAIPDSGIWFAHTSEQKDLDVADYGSTIVTPEYVNGAVEYILHQSVLRMDEADWWGHQDLYIVRNSKLS